MNPVTGCDNQDYSRGESNGRGKPESGTLDNPIPGKSGKRGLSGPNHERGKFNALFLMQTRLGMQRRPTCGSVICSKSRSG